jgi:hypothetical protein
MCSAWRPKLNGHLLTRSPLSSLEELEMLRLDELISSARRQADLLEELRVRAAAQITAR